MTDDLIIDLIKLILEHAEKRTLSRSGSDPIHPSVLEALKILFPNGVPNGI